MWLVGAFREDAWKFEAFIGWTTALGALGLIPLSLI